MELRSTTPRPVTFVCGDLCNLGDLALLLQNVELADGRRRFVRRWAPLPVEIERQVEEAGGELVDGRRLRRFLALAWRSDVVIGGGQLVRDNVSLRGLVFLALGCAAARLGGGQVKTRGLGVSRIANRPRRLLWKGVLTLADRVLVRDQPSFDNAAALVGGAKVVLTADMAFVETRLHETARAAGEGPPRILIAPCIDHSEGRSIDGPGFAALISAARAALPQAEVAFVAHDPRPGMDDSAAELLIRKHGLSGERVATSELARLFALYATAGLVVTNRLHSVIFSLLADRPVLVVADGSGKTAAMAARFAAPSVSVQDDRSKDEAVAAALGYDRARRRAALREMSERAAANLDG